MAEVVRFKAVQEIKKLEAAYRASYEVIRKEYYALSFADRREIRRIYKEQFDRILAEVPEMKYLTSIPEVMEQWERQIQCNMAH